MPELPEVETVVRDLRPLLTGRSIKEVVAGRRPLRRKWNRAWGKVLSGAMIETVRRRGKWIICDLSEVPASGSAKLVFHLGMTGQLTIAATKSKLADHTHLRFTLDEGGEQLRFRDVRRFGSATLIHSENELTEFLGGLGPEPFDLKPATWRKVVLSARRCLKAILLDQRIVAGVGNIYADESLFQAKLHPGIWGVDLQNREVDRLHRAMIRVLNRAINQRGSTIRDYIGGSGLRGEFQDEFAVYGRVDQPCVRCDTPIRVIRLAGRSSHYCPQCQPVCEESDVLPRL